MLRLFGRFLVPACAVAALLVGCSNDKAPMGVGTDEAPLADSPAHLLRRLEWSFNHLDESVYQTLFSDDYRFAFSALDTNGNAYQQFPWTREDETISARKLFLGGDVTQPRATSISLMFDRTFVVTGDTRGDGVTRDPRMHKSIGTTVTLNIRTADGQAIDVLGNAQFYVSRGDSAVVPAGLPPDSTHWYIARWEDHTAQATGPRAPTQPPNATPEGARAATPSSWGSVKAMYR